MQLYQDGAHNLETMNDSRRCIIALEIVLAVYFLLTALGYFYLLSEGGLKLHQDPILEIWLNSYQPQLNMMFLAFNGNGEYSWLGPVVNPLIYLCLFALPLFGFVLNHKDGRLIALHVALFVLVFFHLLGFLSAYGLSLGN